MDTSVKIDDVFDNPTVDHVLAFASGQSGRKQLIVRTNVVTKSVRFIVSVKGQDDKNFILIERAIEEYNKYTHV